MKKAAVTDWNNTKGDFYYGKICMSGMWLCL